VVTSRANTDHRIGQPDGSGRTCPDHFAKEPSDFKDPAPSLEHFFEKAYNFSHNQPQSNLSDL
jgi:hypothetical protein